MLRGPQLRCPRTALLFRGNPGGLGGPEVQLGTQESYFLLCCVPLESFTSQNNTHTDMRNTPTQTHTGVSTQCAHTHTHTLKHTLIQTQ